MPCPGTGHIFACVSNDVLHVSAKVHDAMVHKEACLINKGHNG
jgi:hypothetical protein